MSGQIMLGTNPTTSARLVWSSTCTDTAHRAQVITLHYLAPSPGLWHSVCLRIRHPIGSDPFGPDIPMPIRVGRATLVIARASADRPIVLPQKKGDSTMWD